MPPTSVARSLFVNALHAGWDVRCSLSPRLHSVTSESSRMQKRVGTDSADSCSGVMEDARLSLHPPHLLAAI